VYAFGCLCIEAIFGTIPYGEYKEDSRVMRLMSNGVPPYELKRDETRFLLVPTELLTRCWAMDPDTRPTAKDLTSTFRNCLLDRYSTAKHLKDSLGDSSLTLSSIEGGTCRARLSGITKDAFSASFSVLSPEVELKSIRVYLYRRVEWIWEVEDDREKEREELTAVVSTAKSLPAGLLSETRRASSANLPTIQFTRYGEDDPNIGIDWDYIAPLFRTAAPTVQGARQGSSWRDYVQEVSKNVGAAQEGHAGSATNALAGPPLRSWARRTARPANLGEASFRRWTPSPSHIRPEGNEYMLPNSFDGLSAERLETGPGLSTSLPNGQARSPKFSRIFGFDA